MRRFLFCCAALLVCTVPCRAGEPAAPAETLIRLTVQPAPAAQPALRYLLLPELKEMNPGNPIQNYLKCFMEQQNFFFDKEASTRRDQLLSMPLKELPAKEVQNYGGSALTQADWAARLDKPDWQTLLKLKAEGVSLLLPDVPSLRRLGDALKVRFRAEVALGRFDDALRTAKTMFALARHLGEHPTLIGDLVGMAVANTAIGPLEEMLEQPGCPNLYWALTNLPNPLISLEPGMEGERVMIQSEFRDLDDRAPMSAEQIQKVVEHIDRLRAFEEVGGRRRKKTRSVLEARARIEEWVRDARRRLVESGVPEARLLHFPAEQVILLDERREYDERRDEIMKIMKLPTWQVEKLTAQAKRAPKPAPRATLLPALEWLRGLLVSSNRSTWLIDLVIAEVKSDSDAPLFGSLVPAMQKVRRAQGRLEQRIALLRHVEALRMYAAGHAGKLPEKLADVEVPLPVDPFTGKPFLYELKDGTAHIRGTPPKGDESIAVYNLHYEITIRK